MTDLQESGENVQPAEPQTVDTQPVVETTPEPAITQQPETVPYAFTAPEGVTVDDAVLTAYTEAAKELNLPKDAAQAIVDKVAPLMAQRQAEAMSSLASEWQNQSRDDPEFGGDKLYENLATAKKAMDTLGTPALKALLESTGLGNHPELIRMFWRAGQQLSEDRFVPAGGTAPQPRDPAALLFPSMNN